MSFFYRFYRSAWLLLPFLVTFFLHQREKRGKENARSLAEKKAIITLPRPPHKKIIWLHAASNGEAMSLLKLIARLTALDQGYFCLLTTGTLTSAKLVEGKLDPAHALHQFAPLDHPEWVSRFLNHWQPIAAIFTESELWPNTLLALQNQNIPAYLLNARMSQQSFQLWHKAWLLPSTARMLANFAMIYAQSEAEADKYKSLGAKNIITGANIKYAAEALPHDAEHLALLQTALKNRPCWLFASGHPGEDIIAAEAHRLILNQHKDALLIYVPRHLTRTAEAESAFKQHAFTLQKRSQSQNALAPSCHVYLADSMGELGLFYRLAPITVVGGSFVPVGGHNPIEPAVLHSAIIFGPHMFNAADIATGFLKSSAAVCAHDAESLAKAVLTLLSDQTARQKRTTAALSHVTAQAKIVDDLLNHLITAITKHATAKVF
jgi:3-deoxy-D-manno-octulosonic-acid transferase